MSSDKATKQSLLVESLARLLMELQRKREDPKELELPRRGRKEKESME